MNKVLFDLRLSNLMTKPSKPASPSLRFLFLGGWTAVKAATGGSFCAVFLTLLYWDVYQLWHNGPGAIDLTSSGLQSLLPSVAFLVLVAILLSAVPAFLGGVLLAWLLARESPPASPASPGNMTAGLLVGAAAGAALSLLVLLPADLVGRIAHGGVGYDLGQSLPVYMFYAAEFIGIGIAAGMWTERQLRKQMEGA